MNPFHLSFQRNSTVHSFLYVAVLPTYCTSYLIFLVTTYLIWQVWNSELLMCCLKIIPILTALHTWSGRFMNFKIRSVVGNIRWKIRKKSAQTLSRFKVMLSPRTAAMQRRFLETQVAQVQFIFLCSPILMYLSPYLWYVRVALKLIWVSTAT